MITTHVRDTNTLAIEILEEVKTYVKVDGSTFDAELTASIEGAIDYISDETGIELGYSTITEVYWGFSHVIELAIGSTQSITSIKYYDTDNAQQTLSSDDYDVLIPLNLPARITPTATTSFPATYARPNAVEVVQVAGFSDVSGTYTGPLQGIDAIKQYVLYMFVNRGDEPVQMPKALFRLIDHLSVRTYVK